MHKLDLQRRIWRNLQMADSSAVDGSIVIDSRIDRSGVNEGMEDIAESIETGFKKASDAASASFGKVAISIAKLSPVFKSVFAKLSGILAGIAPEVVAVLAALFALGYGATKVFGSIKRAIESVRDRIKKFVQDIKDKLSQTMQKFLNSMKFIFNYFARIVFRSFVFSIIRGIRSVIAAGMEVNKMNLAMEELRITTQYLTADLLSLFAPQIDLITRKLIDFLNIIRQVIAALKGQSTYTKLVVNDLKQAGSAAKEAIGGLAAFDRIDVLQQPKPGGGAGVGESEIEEVIEEIDSRWMEIAKKIAEIIDKIKAKITELWNTLEPFRKFIQQVGDSLLNNFLIPIAEWTLGEGWDKFVEITERLMQNVDWNSLADSVDRFVQAVANLTIESFQGLITFYDKFLEPVAEWTLNEAIPKFLDSLSSAVENIDWENLQESWSNLLDSVTAFTLLNLDNLLDFVTEVLIPIGEWVVDEAVPRFFDTLSHVLDIFTKVLITLQPHWDTFFDTVLVPITAWSADKFLRFWDFLNKKLAELAIWMDENPEKVERFFEFIGVTAVASIAALGVVLAPVVLLFGLLALAVLTALIPFILLTAAVFGIIVVFNVLLYYAFKLGRELAKSADAIKEAWDEVKEKMQEVKEDLIQKWEDLKEKNQQFWQDMKSKTSEILSDIKADVAEEWDEIKDKITTAVELTVDFVIQKWNELATAFQTEGIKGALNVVLGWIESFVNGAVAGLNSLISALNSFSVSIPPVTVAGRVIWQGTTIGGFNIPSVGNISIPRLATGAVIPPNSEFLAVLGDQRHGTNIEAPEDTIRGIFREELSAMLADQNITIGFAGSFGAVVREMKPYIDKENKRIGTSLVRNIS